MLRRLLPPLLVLIAALAATWPALQGDFLYDDQHYLVDNPAVSGEASPLTTPLGDPSQGLYRPLTVLSWRVQYAGPDDPGPLRAGNVLLHVLAALLLLGLAADLGLPRSAGLLAALLFAVHPAHAEAVAWVTGRAELLAAVLVLAAWRLHLRPGILGALGAAVLAGLAVLAKENAVAAPALLVLGDLLFVRRRVDGKRLLLLAGAVLGAFALRLAVLPGALPVHGPYLDLPLQARLTVALAVLSRALELLVLPLGLRIEYQRDELLQLAGVDLAVLGLAVVAVAVLWRRCRPAAAGLLLVPVALVTVLHLVPIGEPFAERFLYLPSVPFCLAVGALLGSWGRREVSSGRGLGPSLATAALLLAAAVPASRAACAVFHDEVSLWTQAASVAPRVTLARYNLGLALERAGGRDLTEDVDRPGAIDELEASLELDPHHAYAPWAHLLLGQHALVAHTGDPPQPGRAARHDRAALALEPGLIEARLDLAGIALLAPQIVAPDEARALLAPLSGRSDLDPARSAAVDDLLRQLSDDSSASTGTSSDEGS
ncbi:MAG: hypothetical protein H6825_00090 [Planctomycetes bacterium]|nr:hypothetical protein [Planctomycetota bacterium]